MKSTFEQNQSENILKSYGVDIQKGRHAAPIGSLSKDGTMKKNNDGWETVKQKIDTSKFVSKKLGEKEIFEANWDHFLKLNPQEQAQYSKELKEINEKLKIPSVKKESVETKRFSDFKGGNSFGEQYKKKAYIEHIESKIAAGMKYDEATMKDYNAIKKHF